MLALNKEIEEQDASNIEKSSVKSKPMLKKMCFKKCKNCKGARCPNFYGHLGTHQDYKNYNGVLHSKKIRFESDIKNAKIPMDNFDWFLVYFLIVICFVLTIGGGVMP